MKHHKQFTGYTGLKLQRIPCVKLAQSLVKHSVILVLPVLATTRTLKYSSINTALSPSTPHARNWPLITLVLPYL